MINQDGHFHQNRIKLEQKQTTSRAGMNIHLMIGSPGAGKSHYCENEFKDLEIISCDKLREELFGDKRSFEIRETIKKIIKKIIAEKIPSGLDIVIDTTYFNEVHERAFLFKLGRNIKIHAIYIDSTLENCLEQNKMRPTTRVVPDEMVAILFDRVCKPKYSEGFTSVKIVCAQNQKQ